ncbi:MAG: Hsp33 family molecular chaperone HslO [Myxococcota bacterium]
MSEERVGRFVAALANEGRVRVMATVVDGPADVVRARHGLSGAAALLAAEGVAASTLLAAHVKGEERLTVDLHCDHPPFAFTCDVNGDGTVRARFRPDRLPPLHNFTGMMSVMKSLGRKELYRGLAEVRRERFQGALQRYLTSSQQVDGRVRVHAELGPSGEVAFAAGLLVERLPDLPAEEFAAQFDGALAGDFRELMTAFAFGQLAGSPIEVLGSRDLVFHCGCSRDRVVGMLRALGKPEIRSMLAEQGRAEVTCHYCNSVYDIDADGLRRLLEEPSTEN